MWDLINKLPEDILSYILPFTYKPQSSVMLTDLVSFVETKTVISNIYEKKYNDLLEYEKKADKNWLISDILLFMKLKINNHNCYKQFQYLYNDYIITNKDSCSQFNIFWALLNPNERDIFVKIRTPKKVRLW